MNIGESQESPASGEPELRGAELGSQQISAVDQLTRSRDRNPDVKLRLDGEKDTLYSDGLEIDSDGDTLAGTDGAGPEGIKG
jgi:hypothetical protein